MFEACSSVSEPLETTVSCAPGTVAACPRWEAARADNCPCNLLSLPTIWAKQEHPALSCIGPVPDGKGPTQRARHSSLMLTACSLAGRIHVCEQKNPSILQAAAGWQAHKLLVTAS